MKRNKIIEIIADENNDRNIVFFYKKNGSICGLNFHQGVDSDEESNGFDPTYLLNDEKLLKIYLDICKKSAPTQTDFDKLETANLAIEIWMVKTQEWMKESIIKSEVDAAVGVLFEKCHQKCYTTSGDIDPNQEIILDLIKSNLQTLILKQINQNL